MEQTPQIECLQLASESTGGILAGVSASQLGLATPCDDWRVGDLIDHIVGAAEFFADVAEQRASAEEREWLSYADGDFVTSFGESARRILTAFEAPGAMDRTMMLPTGPTPGSRCIEVVIGEMFIHGWDLARATGQAMAPPAGECVAVWLLASGWPALCAEVRAADASVFALALDVPDDAPAVDRLAAFLGRDPGWPSA
jgi:uncharacterized protein (TIGR03086 family)